MDALVLKAIAIEIDRALKGGVIDKVHQPDPTTVTLEIRLPSGREDKQGMALPKLGHHYQLLLSADSQQPRVHLSDIKAENPQTPPAFCMLLRKHLVGCRLVEVSLRGLERVLYFHLEKRDPIGRILKYLLIAEIMGKHSNLLLAEGRTGLIIDVLKFVPATKSVKRPLQRNLPYEPPPSQGRLDPLAVQEEEFLTLAAPHTPGEEGWLVETFEGLSPLAARAIARLSVKEGWWPAFRAIQERVVKGEFVAGLLVRDGGPETLTALPPSDGERVVAFESMNAAANEFYGHRVEKERLESRRRELLKKARALLSRLRRTAKAIRGDLERAEGAEAMKRKGEILSLHTQSVPKGAEAVTLTDPQSGEAVEIPLEPGVSASENAQRYFRRYKKLKRLLGYGPRRLKAIEAEVSRVEPLEAALKAAPDLSTLEALASEASFERLEKRGERDEREAPPAAKAEGPKAKGRKEKKPKEAKGRKAAPRAYRVHPLKEGWEILVGKDSRGNDQLLREVARPEDLWLHAEGLPGSHVLLRRKGAKGEIPLPVLEAAASLAAHHSKAKGSTKVPVVYTLVKHVRRVKAGRSGQMTYTGEKTLIVPPKPLAKEGEEKA